MSDEQEQRQQQAQRHIESQAAVAAHQVGIEHQSQSVHSRKHNPDFYQKYTATSLAESEKWSHLVNEHAAWLADDHVLSNRRQVHRLQRELLNKARAEQSVVGATPGVRLHEKPLLNALSQGVHPEIDSPVPLTSAGQQSVEIDGDEFTQPMDAEERTVMDDLANLATARQAMGVDRAGSEALTTATTENRTVREDESEESGIANKVSGVFD